MGRLRGFLWLIAGVFVAALAGGVAFVALSRATAERAATGQILAPQQRVVVAARLVGIRDVLTAEHLEVKEIPVETVPEGAIADVDQAIGRISLVELYPGEVILAQRLLDPNVVSPDGRMALVMADDEVLLAFPASDLLSQVEVLKPGDRVDFLFTHQLPIDRGTGFLPFGQSPGPVAAETGEEAQVETVTFDLLQNVAIAAIVRQVSQEGTQGAPRALLLAVAPQDALVLKYMKDVGATMDLVLRAPGAEGEFVVEPVDLDYVINGYIVPTEGVR